MTEISFSRRGSGDPIVMVHGIGSRWQVFEPIMDALADHHDVIAVDLPGFGASPMVEGVAPGPIGYADWLTEWFAELGIERPHVVGNSMGGGIALELGRRGVASAATAFSPAGFWDTPGLKWAQGLITGMRETAKVAGPVIDRTLTSKAGRVAVLGPFFGQPGKIPVDVARADVAALAGAPAYPEARRAFNDFRYTTTTDAGKLRDIPVTIAWGTRDVVLLHRTQSARARAVFPFARHVALAACGHVPFLDDPEACARVVLEDAGS